VALIGASGSGKSTAVRSVAYLLEPARPCASAGTTHKGELRPWRPPPAHRNWDDAVGQRRRRAMAATARQRASRSLRAKGVT